MTARAVLRLAVLLGILSLPVAGYCANSSTASTSHLVLPQGQVLSDEELLVVTGDGAVALVFAGAIISAATSAGVTALIDWANGGGVSGWRVVYSAVGGAFVGGFATAVHATAAVARALVAAQSSLASAARWSGQAAASFGATAHSALHHNVRMPIQQAFTSTWRWMIGK